MMRAIQLADRAYQADKSQGLLVRQRFGEEMFTRTLSVCRTSGSRFSMPSRPGLTIVEMIVSLVCVVMLMLAYTQLFSDVGGRIGEARSMIELSHRMNTAEQRLRADLAGITCDLLPPRDPNDGGGYVEIIEGQLNDPPPGSSAYGNNGRSDDSTTTDIDESLFPLGDIDDVLMFTVRSKDAPFTGRIWVDANSDNVVQPGEIQTVQSQVAEVVWFLRPTLKEDGKTPLNPPTYTLYRRVFLVLPNISPNRVLATKFDANSTLFDWSVHPETDPSGTTSYVANTLGDLTKRECRFGHESLVVNFPAGSGSTGKFPHRVIPSLLVPFGGSLDNTAPVGYKVDTSNARYGEDVVLTNVTSFDIQVWDPTAPVKVASAGVAVVPGDPGFAGAGSAVSAGAFVDLNYGTAMGLAPGFSTFSGPGVSNSTVSGKKLVADPYTPTYDKPWLRYLLGDSLYKQPATWDSFSNHYEHDGIQQLSGPPSVIDRATNGFDDDGNGIVDDVGERETIAPYPFPLRGIKIRIRCYEPDSRQVHEVTVVESFVPQ